MEYPIDERVFSELVRSRSCMDKANPHPDRIGIAGPFVPWIGDDILNNSPGIYFVGIATAGRFGADEECTLQSRREYSKNVIFDKDNDLRSSIFWRYINCITKAVYGANYKECLHRIAWSNQFKIGVSLGNPEGIFAQEQKETCVYVLKRELELASLCPFVFLGSGRDSLIDEVCEGYSCDKQRLNADEIWTFNRENGTPILYQNHPRSLPPKRLFDSNVEIIAAEIRCYLKTIAPSRASQ